VIEEALDEMAAWNFQPEATADVLPLKAFLTVSLAPI
jgi:hypothetical protein